MELILFLGIWFVAIMFVIGLDILRVKWLYYWRTHGERPFSEPWEYSPMEEDINFWSVSALIAVVGIIVYIAGWWVGVW